MLEENWPITFAFTMNTMTPSQELLHGHRKHSGLLYVVAHMNSADNATFIIYINMMIMHCSILEFIVKTKESTLMLKASLNMAKLTILYGMLHRSDMHMCT